MPKKTTKPTAPPPNLNHELLALRLRISCQLRQAREALRLAEYACTRIEDDIDAYSDAHSNYGPAQLKGVIRDFLGSKSDDKGKAFVKKA